MKLIRLAVAVVAAAVPILAVPTASSAVVAAPHTVAHRTVGPGFLRDGDGTGKAASAVPGHAPAIGNNVDTFGAGAWRTQWNGDGTICLTSAPHYCFADNGGLVKWRAHDPSQHTDQVWILIGGSEIQNEYSRNYLCATGGDDFVIITQTLNNCSSYHSSWAYSSTASKTATAPSVTLTSAHGLAPGCQHVLFTAGDANRPAVVCYGLKQPAPGKEWNLVLDGTTSFTIHKGSVIQAFQFTPSTPAHTTALARPQGNHDGVSPTTVVTTHVLRVGSPFCEINTVTRCLSAVPGGHPVAGDLADVFSSGYWNWNFVQCCVVHRDTFKYTPIYNALHGQAVLQFTLAATSNPTLELNNHAGTADFINAGTNGSNALWVYDSATGWLVNIGRSNDMDNWEVLCGHGVGSAATITTRNACTHKSWESN